MSEHTSTPQVEEVKVADAVDNNNTACPVQQLAAVEVSDANKKVVESENKLAETATEAVASEESAPSKLSTEEKEVVESSEAENKEPSDESKQDDKVVEEKQDKVVEEKPDKLAEEKVEVDQSAVEQLANEEVVAQQEVTNGDAHQDKKVDEPAVEETNGICKRKVENGAEAVEDEKSPKKAKVVDDGDQAPVEETAA